MSSDLSFLIQTYGPNFRPTVSIIQVHLGGGLFLMLVLLFNFGHYHIFKQPKLRLKGDHKNGFTHQSPTHPLPTHPQETLRQVLGVVGGYAFVCRLLLGYKIGGWAGIIIDNICPGINCPGDNCHLSRHTVLYFK